jgi:BirA family transcriptional regulator, biotin operon repressor / biotin---[acetyl-CoA-carboxylase] ligase
VSYNLALLHALAPGQPVSGPALGRALGISRAAVWKGVRRLVELGLEIEARPGQGYCLATPLVPLEAAAVRAALPPEAAERLAVLEVLAETGSTNSRVLAAERPVGELVACLAEFQTAGRGRRGRCWQMPPGAGICLSVGGRLAAAPGDLAALPAAAGVACAEALEHLGVTGVGLKWPNDLLLGGGKLGGILIELRGEAGGPTTVAAGIGLNVALGPRARAAIIATGGLPPAELAATGRPAAPDRNALAAALLAALTACLGRVPASLGAAELAAWRRRDALLGRTVRVDANGGELAGIARGLDPGGALLLEADDGRCHRITAGEASLRRPA